MDGPFSKSFQPNSSDAFTGLAVPVGIDCSSHLSVRMLIFDQSSGLSNDHGCVGTDQPRRTSIDPLLPFGYITHHQHRLAQGWSLLLDTPGIRQDKMTTDS